MAKSLNRVTLLGNLGRDPEVRATPSGGNVTTLNIATTRSYKDQSGNWQDKTEWHRVVCWNRLADTASQYLHKGDRVYIEGELRYGSYEKDGITRYTTDIVANDLVFTGNRNDGGGGGGYNPAPQQAPYNESFQSAPQQQQGNQQSAPAQKPQSQPANNYIEDDDDDVPF